MIQCCGPRSGTECLLIGNEKYPEHGISCMRVKKINISLPLLEEQVRGARRPQNLGMHAQLGMLGRCSAARMQKSPTSTSGIAVDIALGLTYVLSRGIQLRPEIQDHGLRNTKYLPVRATPHRAPNNGTAENHTTTMILTTQLFSELRRDFAPTVSCT